jgi:hypothetical protein
MGVHRNHSTLDGYDSRQIWFDHCKECEERSATLPGSIMTLDIANFTRAMHRTLVWNKDHEESIEDLGRISDAERPLLRQLWVMHLIVECYGLQVLGGVA